MIRHCAFPSAFLLWLAAAAAGQTSAAPAAKATALEYGAIPAQCAQLVTTAPKLVSPGIYDASAVASRAITMEDVCSARMALRGHNVVKIEGGSVRALAHLIGEPLPYARPTIHNLAHSRTLDAKSIRPLVAADTQTFQQTYVAAQIDPGGPLRVYEGIAAATAASQAKAKADFDGWIAERTSTATPAPSAFDPCGLAGNTAWTFYQTAEMTVIDAQGNEATLKTSTCRLNDTITQNDWYMVQANLASMPNNTQCPLQDLNNGPGPRCGPFVAERDTTINNELIFGGFPVLSNGATLEDWGPQQGTITSCSFGQNFTMAAGLAASANPGANVGFSDTYSSSCTFPTETLSPLTPALGSGANFAKWEEDFVVPQVAPGFPFFGTTVQPSPFGIESFASQFDSIVQVPEIDGGTIYANSAFNPDIVSNVVFANLSVFSPCGECGLTTDYTGDVVSLELTPYVVSPSFNAYIAGQPGVREAWIAVPASSTTVNVQVFANTATNGLFNSFFNEAGSITGYDDFVCGQDFNNLLSCGSPTSAQATPTIPVLNQNVGFTVTCEGTSGTWLECPSGTLNGDQTVSLIVNGVNSGTGKGVGIATFNTSPLAVSPAVEVDPIQISVNLYEVPAVSSVSPPSGTALGGNSVVIDGSGFSAQGGPNGAASIVYFGSVPEYPCVANGNPICFTVVSDGQINAVAPPVPAATPGSSPVTKVDVRVQTPGGETAIAEPADVYTYTYNTPAITKVQPTQGAAPPPLEVAITGSGFTGASAVAFGPSIISPPCGAASGKPVIGPGTCFTVLSDSQIAVSVPNQTWLAVNHLFGTVDMRVTTPGGTSAVVSADHFQLLEVFRPVVCPPYCPPPPPPRP